MREGPTGENMRVEAMGEKRDEDKREGEQDEVRRWGRVWGKLHDGKR